MINEDSFYPARLRAFVAVAESNSFTRAAERLGISQPSVSIQVRRLEDAVGRSLFDRNSPSMRLTLDGEKVLEYARELLAVVDRARHHFAPPPLHGTVRFGLIDIFEATGLPEILGELRRAHQRFELLTRTGLSAELVRWLDAGEVDLVLAKRVAGRSSGEFFGRQRLVWVGRPEAVAGEEGVLPLALPPAPSVTRNLVLQTLHMADRRYVVRFESVSRMGLRAAALAGLGVTVFGVGMIPEGVESLVTSELPPLPDAEYILEQNPHSRNAVVNAFAASLRRAAPLLFEPARELRAEVP